MFPLPVMIFFTQTDTGRIFFYVSNAGYNKFTQEVNLTPIFPLSPILTCLPQKKIVPLCWK